ncbi:hypothetical protein ACTFIZ_011862 [Dictyostelium cf. discoideum]
MEERKINLKFFIGGDSGVGKSSIIKSFLGENYENKTPMGDCHQKEIDFDGRHVVLRIWDIPNKMNYPLNMFYRGADCIFLCFDLNNLTSFENLEKWLHDFLFSASYVNVPIIILGNKIDLKNENNSNNNNNNNEIISKEKIDEWCKKQQDKMINGNFNKSYFCGIHYFETSAKESINIQESFIKGLGLAIKFYKGEPECSPVVFKQEIRNKNDRFCWCANVTDCSY